MKKMHLVNFVVVLVVLVSATASAQLSDGCGGTSYRVATPTQTAVVYANSNGDPTNVASLRGGIVAARPVSSGDPQIDADNNRTDLQWARVAQQREQQNQRANLELTRIAVQRERNLLGYSLDKQVENRRDRESWSDMISEQLNDANRRSLNNERMEIQKRQQRQHEIESANRSIERATDRLLRQVQR